MSEYSEASQHTTIFTCQWCGCLHPNQTCPRVKKIEYHPDGTVKNIEFHELKSAVR